MEIHVLRNLVLRYGVELKLTAVEKELIWHLLDHDHNGKGYSYPSEVTISKRMGISERYVRRLITALWRKKNLISIQHKRGRSNEYRYHGIMKAMIPFLTSETVRSKNKVERSENQLSLLSDGSAPLRNSSSAHSGTPVPPNSSINSSNKLVSNVRSETHETSLKNQFQKLATNEQIIAHLRSLAASGNGEADSASKTLMLLEQLWEWNATGEIKKSWAWFQSCARKYPHAFDRAFSELKTRMSSASSLKPLRAPGAYFTTLVKSYAVIS